MTLRTICRRGHAGTQGTLQRVRAPRQSARRCHRDDLRRWPDGIVVEYIDQRSMKPLGIQRLVQKVV